MQRWRDRNLSLMELVIAIALVAVLIGAFARHVLIIFARAESTLINTTLVNMNTALNYYALTAAMKNEKDKLVNLQQLNVFMELQDNPDEVSTVSVTDEKNVLHHNMPAKYLGAFPAPDLEWIPKGYWFFDTSDNALVYRVSNTEYFHSELPGAPRIRLKIYIEYEDMNSDGEFDPLVDKFLGAKLNSPDRYQWLFAQ